MAELISDGASKRRRSAWLLAFAACACASLVAYAQYDLAVQAGAAKPSRSQVFVLRHCVRSTTDKVKRASPTFKRSSAFSAYPLPEWGALPTAAGVHIGGTCAT